MHTNKEYIKKTFNGLLSTNLIFFALSTIFLFLYFYSDAPLLLSVIFGIVSLVFIPIFIVTYKDIKCFSLNFDETGIRFKCRKTTISINYSNLTVCGLIRRVGSKSWSDIVLDLPSKLTYDSKNTFIFTSKDTPNLKKIVWHIQTSTGVCHGFYKDICCISDYQGSPIFSKCFDTIEIYCENFPFETINIDREDL